MFSIDSNKLRMFVHLFCIFDAWDMSSKIVDVDLRTPKCLLVDEQLTFCQPIRLTFMISFFMPNSNRKHFCIQFCRLQNDTKNAKTFIFLEVPPFIKSDTPRVSRCSGQVPTCLFNDGWEFVTAIDISVPSFKRVWWQTLFLCFGCSSDQFG